MAATLSHCPHLARTLARLQRFHLRRPPDLALAVMKPPSPALARWASRWPEGYCDYPDPAQRAAFWDDLLAERAGIDDDCLPAAYLSEMDQGLYGGLVGGKASFLSDAATGWISSMVEPILDDLAGVEGLSLPDAHPWLDRYLRQLDLFAARAQGRFGISHFILINGLNFVYELVGATKTYEEVLDRPELVGRAMELAHRVNLRVQQAFFARVGLLEGGTVSNMLQWIPGGRIVSESVDPFHMTSPDYFETWGKGVLERIFGDFEGGAVHIHGNGRHLLEAVSKVQGLRGIYLGDDRGYPLAFDVLDEIRAKVGDMPLALGVPFDRFLDALERGVLRGGVIYYVSDVPDVATANRVARRLRGEA